MPVSPDYMAYGPTTEDMGIDQMADAKPLTWRVPSDHPQDREDAAFMADGIGGRYSVTRDGLLWFAHDEFVWEQFPSVADAKEAAERDWQKRFSALMAAA